MLTNIKSESNAPFLNSPPLAHKIIFFEKKSTYSSKIWNYKYFLAEKKNKRTFIWHLMTYPVHSQSRINSYLKPCDKNN